MRRQKIALLMMSFAMGSTMMIGCGDTTRLRTLDTLYQFVVGLAFEALVAQLTA